MVGALDLKVYRTTSDLGGAITGTQINSASPNNLFINVPKNELVTGIDYYKCVYFKNTHATESMDELKLWLSDKSFPHDTEIKWGFDPTIVTAIQLDGVNDLINCGIETGLWNQSQTKFSASIWFYSNDWTGIQFRNLISCQNGTDDIYIGTDSGGSPGKMQAAVTPDAYTNVSQSEVDLPALNQWHHYVITYDSTLSTFRLKLYLDKVVGALTSDDNTGAINQAAQGMILGNYQAATATGGSKGLMQDFRYWTGKALTQEEIDDVYSDSPSAPTPSYWLKMDEGTGDPTDTISGTKVGTLTNGALWNTTAQVIADVYTAPTGVIWNELGTEPDTPYFAKLLAGQSFPIWIWYHVSANAQARLDDSELFSFNFKIPQGGTGDPGGGAGDGGSGGGGGNPPPPSTDYKIAVAGDWGCENETDDVINLIKDYDLIVGVGDNAYSSPDCWINRFNSIKSKFESAMGNHEYEESGGVGPYKTFFGYDKTYLSFQFQNFFFIIMDTNINFDSGSAQYNFVQSELTRVLNDSTITWRACVFHHPMFGASSQHTYNDGNFNQTYQKMFQSNKVNFCFEGHNHNFQRTFQVVYNSGDPESPTVVDNSSPYSAATEGIINVISGAGGHDSGSSLYSLGSQPSFQAYQNRTHNGAWEMVASNNGQTLTCSFVDTDGIKYDTFVINA